MLHYCCCICVAFREYEWPASLVKGKSIINIVVISKLNSKLSVQNQNVQLCAAFNKEENRKVQWKRIFVL